MEALDRWLSAFSSQMWGLPLLILLIGGGMYFAVLSRGIPWTLLGKGIRLWKTKLSHSDAQNISPFQSLATALSSTIGMGNIAGVAVAISIGGPGAIFWMWVSGLIGMVTKFFTCTLSVMYRKKNAEGKWLGGPMYFIELGLGTRWKPLATAFAVFGLVGALPVFNANQFTQAFNDIILSPGGIKQGFAVNMVIAIGLLVLTSIVTIGGIKSIGRTAERLVPAMVFLYLISVFIILVVNANQIWPTIMLIFSEAFNPQHYRGDTFLGGALGGLILLGIRRGAFSNEAGIGTAPLAHSASSNTNAIQEGLSAMMGPFIDTIIVCTLTALAILVTGVWQSSPASGVSLTNDAFEASIPKAGSYLLMVCIAVFSISSLFSFSYYGEKCTAYLLGEKYAKWYQIPYLGAIILGCVTTLDMMINLIDGFYALMAWPTMVGALLLSGKVMKQLRLFLSAANTEPKI